VERLKTFHSLLKIAILLMDILVDVKTVEIKYREENPDKVREHNER
jgi:hypothetical protein